MTPNPLDPDPREPRYFLYQRARDRHRLRATFVTGNEAYMWQEGSRGRVWADLFFITNPNGQPVTLADHPGRPGHACGILDALDRSDRP